MKRIKDKKDEEKELNYSEMTIKKVKRFIVTLIGFTVLIIGMVMIVFPGPALIVIPLGLAILGTEYVWVNKMFEKIKKGVKKTFDK